MAAYWYIALDEHGNKFSGTYRDIASIAALRDEMTKIGCRLLKARKAKETNLRRKRVSPREVVAFAYQFAGMYSAGLSVLQCLSTMEQQVENLALREILSEIRQNVEAGSSLKKAFEKYQDIFTSFFVGMIEAGEAGGKLGQALEMSAVYLEKRLEVRQKVKSAFVYPLVVSVVCCIVVGSLLLFVVPMFAKLYGRLHVALPGPTQLLISLSDLIRNGWFFILMAVVGGTYLWRRAMKKPEFRAWIDDIKLNMPVFGKLNRMAVTSRFIRTFATLVSVGVPLIEAIDVARTVANNSRMDQIGSQIQESIRAGNPVAQSLRVHRIFPPMVVQMADSGEQAGILPEMLFKSTDFLDKDIDRIVSSLLVKLEPILTLVMGVIIGLILLGVYLPMFDYMNHLS